MFVGTPERLAFSKSGVIFQVQWCEGKGLMEVSAPSFLEVNTAWNEKLAPPRAML